MTSPGSWRRLAGHPSRCCTSPGRGAEGRPTSWPISVGPCHGAQRLFVVARTGWQHVDHQVRRVENSRVHIKLLSSRSLGLVGPLAAEDREKLVEAISSLGPGGPITLDFEGVTSIEEGGMEALRQAISRVRDGGEVLLTLLVPSRGLVDELRASGLDEDPMVLIETPPRRRLRSPRHE